MEKYKTMNGSNLAYIGDAYYELVIREHLLNCGLTKSNDLRKASLKYVSAHAHANIFHKIQTELTTEEYEIFKKGRNNFSKARRKNVDLGEYAISSGLEALIGYLYLSKNETRLNELMMLMIKKVEEE